MALNLKSKNEGSTARFKIICFFDNSFYSTRLGERKAVRSVQPAKTIIALTIIPTATQPATTAKPRCNPGPLKRSLKALTNNIAATEPDANGIAMDQFISPIITVYTTPAADTVAITASDVETIDRM